MKLYQYFINFALSITCLVFVILSLGAAKGLQNINEMGFLLCLFAALCFLIGAGYFFGKILSNIAAFIEKPVKYVAVRKSIYDAKKFAVVEVGVHSNFIVEELDNIAGAIIAGRKHAKLIGVEFKNETPN